MMDITNLSTEELRQLKKEIEAELSKRHKAKEEEKCSCWTCGHCYYDDNAHQSYPKGLRDGYRCMAWKSPAGKGRIISTKHKAPVWCPIKEVKEENGKLKTTYQSTVCKDFSAIQRILIAKGEAT